MAKREVRCEACGTLNSVASYSVRRIPNCGKCHAALPEHGAIKALRKLYVLRRSLAIAIFAGFLAWASWDQIREALNPPPACTIQASPRQGVYRWYTNTDDIAAFTITTARGSDYFVKLEDAQSAKPVMSFFVRGGSALTNKVPLGSFILKYASGQSWCNERDLFGPDTATKQADHIFTFERRATGNGYILSEWTVELVLQRGGNLRTHTIPRSKF